MDIPSSPTQREQSFSAIANDSSPQGDKKIVAPLPLNAREITIEPSESSAIDHAKSAEKFSSLKHSEGSRTSPISMEQAPDSPPTPNNLAPLRRGIKWADEYGKDLTEVSLFTPHSDEDDSASAEITEIDSRSPVFSLKVLDDKTSELLEQKQASISSEIMEDDKKIYGSLPREKAAIESTKTQAPPERLGHWTANKHDQVTLCSEARPHQAAPAGPTPKEASAMRNAFREIATWAVSKNNETLSELRNAKAALRWAKKNDTVNVPSLKAWVSIASAGHQAAEKYASWTEARHKASLTKVWIEPGVPGASENVASTWADQWDREPKQDNSENDDTWRSVKSDMETAITQDWTPAEIAANWDLAQDAIWAKEDPEYAAVKIIATHYAALQFAEDKKISQSR